MRIRCSLPVLRWVGILCAMLGAASLAAAASSFDPDTVPEAYRASVAALTCPGATRAFQVTPTGDLYNGAWWVRLKPRDERVAASSPRAIAYEGRWCPVLHWRREARGVRWDFEAVAMPEPEPSWFSPAGPIGRELAALDRRADRRSEQHALAAYSPEQVDRLLLRSTHPIERLDIDRRGFVASIRVTVTNLTRRTHTASLTCRVEPPGADRPYSDADTLARIRWGGAWKGATPSDSVLGLAAGRIDGREIHQSWRLRRGEHASYRLLLPVYPMRASALARYRHRKHDSEVMRTRRYWREEVGRGASFDIPDPAVMQSLRASRVLLLTLRERRASDVVPIGGPFHYRDVWLRDGARAMVALAMSGYTHEALELARSFLLFQWPHGPFMSQTGQLDGTGQALWAFEQVALRSPPGRDRAAFADAAVRAWRAVERSRRLARQDGVPGMLPLTDPHDGELVRAQLVGNDAWALAGYRAAVRLLRASHRYAQADSVELSRLRYLGAFRAALSRTSTSDVPASWQGIGRDWGNLNVAYPCEVLSPDDRHLEGLWRRYWARAGGAGIGYYDEPECGHTYIAADLGTWALLHGEPAMADSVLAGLLAWRSASGGWAETFSRRRRDFDKNFPPHPTAAAAFLMLVRNSLIFDDGEALQLTLGPRPGWWSGTTVHGAPTRWGPVDLSFRRRGERVSWQWTPVPVWTEVALPQGMMPAGLPAGALRGARANVVRMKPGTSSLTVSLRPANPQVATALTR